MLREMKKNYSIILSLCGICSTESISGSEEFFLNPYCCSQNVLFRYEIIFINISNIFENCDNTEFGLLFDIIIIIHIKVINTLTGSLGCNINILWFHTKMSHSYGHNVSFAA